ncbi:MAG: glycosyltransferase [Roseiarcus sp.]
MNLGVNETDTDPIRLSILLVSYNQQDYVERAVRGILEQDLPSGGVELVVADDFSSDGTLSVIKTLLADAPGYRLRFIGAAANVGITRNYQRGFSACRGEYIAIIEGDDYWVYPGKLRRQVAFLDAHRECSACGTNYYVFTEVKSSFELKFPNLTGYFLVDACQLARGNIPGNFSNLMYRRDVLQALPPEVFSIRAHDWLVNILVAQSGPLAVLNRPMSVYRVHGGGTWSNLPEREKALQVIADIETYDRFTNFRFHDEFRGQLTYMQDIAARRGQSKSGAGNRKTIVKRYVTILTSFLPPVIVISIRAVLRVFKSLIVPPALHIALKKAKRRAYADLK